MLLKRLATFAAAIIISAPALASDFNTMGPSSTMFYMAVPIDARSDKERMPYFGLVMQGSRPYETFNLNTRMFDDKRFGFLPLGGLETKWLVVGAVGVAAAVAVGSQDKSTVQAHQAAQQQQAAEQQQKQEECPVVC